MKCKLFEFDYDMLPGVDLEMLTEEDIGRLFVDSSNVKSFWYKSDPSGLGTLTVEFLSDTVYEYYDVPYQVAYFFTKAPSFGRFMWRNIRNKYDYERVNRNKAISLVGKPESVGPTRNVNIVSGGTQARQQQLRQQRQRRRRGNVHRRR